MNISGWSLNLKALKQQRNYSFCLNIFLSFVVLLCLLIFVRISSNHTTVVVPANFTSEVTIHNNGVDEAYLLQWSEFIVSLKLNVTPDSIIPQSNNMLKYVSSSSYAGLKKHLAQEASRIQADEISSVFHPRITKSVSVEELKARVEGMLKVYIGENLHQSSNVIYELDFEFFNGRLLLKSFREITNDA